MNTETAETPLLLLAYHDDPAIKRKYISRVRMHRLADTLIQGTGWEDGKGCAVGCTLETYEHDRYTTELGIPVVLAHLEDRLFELQTKADATLWPERFLSAIRPGADLARVWPEWAIWMLVDPTFGVINRAKGYPEVETAVRRVAELWRTGGTPEEFEAARRAAAAAADAADAATATVYAADAAYAYAAAAAAAYAAADAAAAAARPRWVKAACDKLVALLEAAR